MKITKLLLGSAAAIVAVSGARAADAVILSEPEPVEYVRVCDVYGAGWIYIPGTETCISINGYIFAQTAASSYKPGAGDFEPGSTPTENFGTKGDGWLSGVRTRVNIQARSETEWGTLESLIRLQATWGDVDALRDGPVSIDQGWLALGGLFAGYSESAWVASYRGGPTNFGSHSWTGMYYSNAQRHQVGYTYFGNNGFFATLSLEDSAFEGNGYIPDVVAKVGLKQDWGAIWGRFGYEDDISKGGPEGKSAWGASLATQINIPNSPGSSLRVLGYYASGDTRFSSSSQLGVAPEWSVLVSYKHQFTEKLAISVAGQYMSNLYLDGTDLKSDLNAWGAEISTVWTPVRDFEVRPEIFYDKVDGFDGTVSGFLRLTRYF